MHPYLVVPIVACVLSGATALALWMQDPGNRRMRPIVGVGLCCAFWAFCEIGWNQAGDPADAAAWMRAAAIGWSPLGPLALLALAVARDEDGPVVRRWVNAAWIAQIGLLALTLATPWMVAGATRTWWGWSIVAGPALPLQYLVTGSCAMAGLLLWRRKEHESGGLAAEPGPAPASARVSLVHLAIGVPVVVASFTDVLLPLADFHGVPRLGTLSLGFIGVLHLVSYVHFGDSVLAPSGFTGRVLRTLPDGLAYLSLTGTVRATNQRLEEMLGRDAASLLGGTLSAFLPRELLEPPRELRSVDCQLAPPGAPPIEVSVSACLQTDNTGGAAGLVLIIRDQREVAMLRRRALAAGRMAAVGELAAGIAHEVNNPIAYVRANLTTLRESLGRAASHPDDGSVGIDSTNALSEVEELISESLEGIDRVTSIVRDVKEFSYAGPGERQAADLEALLEKTLRVAQLQFPPGVSVERRIDELPLVHCEPQRIKQVFLNLLVNAAQALDEGGAVRLSGTRDGNQVVVRVADDGDGISPEVMERIFDPFFTTKPVGVGTGLGLAIAFGIVESHGGSISVDSKPREGTEFSVRLPIRA
jgi:signal transduction histidine kinase